jgi:serine phosphatase RsbU (regulator of sigma subunit)
MKYFKNFFLNRSIQSRIITFFLVFSILFSVLLIEYIHLYFKNKFIQKLEEDLKYLVEISYNNIVDNFSQVDQGFISYEEALENLKKRFSGPIESAQIQIPNEELEKSITDFFDLLDIQIQTKEILIRKENDKIIQLFIEILDPQPIQVNTENNRLILNFPTRLAEMLYYKYNSLSEKSKNQLLEQYKLRFIRNVNKAVIKIGNDGYIFVVQAYSPEWLLPKTKFPEDYTLEKIQERFKNNFKDYFNSPKDLQEYLNHFGKTPEEQYQYIQTYMKTIKEKPDPAIAIIHPYLENVNLDNMNYQNIFPVRHILFQKEGYFRYPWKNPIDKNVRTKVAYFKPWEYHNYKKDIELNWIIGIGAYEDESYKIVSNIRYNLYFFSFVFFIVIIILYYYFIKFNFIKPINEIIQAMKKVNDHNYHVRLNVYNKDELGYIASTFNFMVRSIRKNNKKLENYAKKLKEMVDQQTQQLREQIEEINQLKEIQDGDYYLTYLLLKQIGQNLAKSNTIKVEFLIKQKKDFTFRNKKGEIGGDICIARTIYLKENPYIFFLNADAMGKSMQGAAGILILGSVMESILERTIQAFIFKNYSPERWLKNSFMELGHIFESFRGSMGATLVMGLIDEKTNTMYYINAEHPNGILYRDQKANFFDTDFHFRRLGASDNLSQNEIIYIKTLQLISNDIIIFGSDGKDDIKLTNGTLNNDETLILRIIQESNGDLQTIFDKILDLGELTDDISLLKIHILDKKDLSITKEDKIYFTSLKKNFKENPEEYLKQVLEFHDKFPHYLPCIKLLIEHYTSKKDFKNIYKYCLKYFEIKPSEYNILYLLFFSLYKQNEFQEAIEYGERCYLRNPTNANLLVQLADCYYQTNQFSRSEYLIEKALDIEPENEKIKAFIKKLRNF